MKHRFKQQAHAEFAEWADTYDKSLLNYLLFEPAHALLLKEIRGLPAGRSLDIGCGTAELAMRLARRGWATFGLDLCEPMLLRAKAKINGHQAVHLAAGDSEHLPFPDAAFDIVICANSFHHYPNQQAVVCEMRRVLRPGGKVFIVDGWPDHGWGWILYEVIVTRIEGGDVWHRNSRDMQSLLAAAGFTTISQKRHHGPFPLVLSSAAAPA